MCNRRVRHARMASAWISRNNHEGGHQFQQEIAEPWVVLSSDEDIERQILSRLDSWWAYEHVRDDLLFNFGNAADIRTFLHIVTGWLHLEVCVCLNGEEYLENNALGAPQVQWVTQSGSLTSTTEHTNCWVVPAGVTMYIVTANANCYCQCDCYARSVVSYI